MSCRVVVLALLPLIGACSATACSATKPLEEPCKPITQAWIEVRVVEHEDALREAYERANGAPSLRSNAPLEGFTGTSRQGWHIFVLPLRHQLDRPRLEVWGHELAHVVCGHWHAAPEH